jgi:DNA-directed RNA polymerase
MATPSEIQRQIELEQEALSCGKQKLHASLQRLHEKSYASASVYGTASISAALPSVIKDIEDNLSKMKKGRAGAYYKPISEHIDNLEPLAIATIALKITFDMVFSMKRDRDLLTSVVVSIGSALEAECKFRWYKTNHPGLMKYIEEKYYHESCGTEQKQSIASVIFGRQDIHWPTWHIKNKTALGSWSLERVCSTTGWFTKEPEQRGRKTVLRLVPTPEFMEVRDQLINTAEMFSGIPWPMLVEPNDWTNEQMGGYLTNELMRGHELTRRGNPTLVHGETPLKFLNKLQKVRYRVNTHVLEVARHFRDKGIKVGKFIPLCEAFKPPKPPDIAENADARQAWKREMAEAYNADRYNFKRSVRTRTQLEAAEKFKDEEYYLCWSFDYRGRTYPIPAYLTPQDTDFGKSLIRFADESFVNEEAEEWLAFQVATTFGLDKAPMDERIQWVRDNHDLITKVAVDPIGNLPEWEVVEEPWQFMAACHEYYHCCIECDHQFTSLMVAVDATCSGLQILAGLAKDQSTASLVNVCPGDRPSDAYKAVAEEAKKYLPAEMHPWMTRKTTKRTVMTIPYNATRSSSWGYIKEALLEQGFEPEKEQVSQVVEAVYLSMDAIVPGPMRVMRWIKTHVGQYIRSGADHVEWTTPSGFVVNQKRNVKETERMELQLLGATKVTVTVGEGNPCPTRHKSSTAPNLIHSLDASILHETFQRFNGPFTVIHDSVLCRATDMGTLNALVRETYTDIFTRDCWLSKFGEAINASEEPPIVGTLDPEVVEESTYFFC